MTLNTLLRIVALVLFVFAAIAGAGTFISWGFDRWAAIGLAVWVLSTLLGNVVLFTADRPAR